ncbi:MAG: tetratricopeptide repeat protein [Prevotella sp.]|nr:tetratricopeptide repeat protein [Prevotella sp.]
MRNRRPNLSLLLVATLIAITSCRQSSVKESQGSILYAQADAAAEEGDAEKAFQLLQDALTNYQKEGDKEGMAASWLALAQMSTDEMQTDSAFAYVDKALALEVSDSMRAALFCEKGTIHIIKGNEREGVHYIRKAMEEGGGAAFKGEDKAVGCGNAALACRHLGLPDSTRFFLEEGIRAAKEVDDDEDLAFLYNNLAICFVEMNRYDEGLEACRKAYEAASRAGDDMESINALANEGVTWVRKGDPAKALKLLEETWPKADSIGNAALQLKVLTYILNATMQLGDAEKTNHYLSISERLMEKAPVSGIQQYGLLGVMNDIRLKKGEYATVLHTLEQMDTTALSNGLYPRDAYLKQKASCLAGQGDYRQAYQAYLQSAAISDSLRGVEAQRQLSELSEQLKAQERETEIARLNKVVVRRQLYAVALAAGLIIVALLAVAYIYRQRRQREKVLSQRYVEGLERERARFARELHDGACNELLGIGMALRSQEARSQDVAERIGQLRDNLRQLSHELMPPQFDKCTLDEILSYYLQHVKTPSLDVQFHNEGDFTHLPKHIAYELYRITQEAVGNIVSHSDATVARVEVKCDHHEVSLCISDNGSRKEENDEKRHHDGIGMQSIHDRAKSIGAELEVSNGMVRLKIG